jgi:hypothetical protein
MEKTKGIIKSIDKMDNDPWTLNGKTFYDFYVKMEEEGEEGRASPIHEAAPPYKVGEEVEYTSTSNHHGTRLKINKPKTESKGGFEPTYSKGTDESIKTQWAIGRAVELTIAEMPSNGNLLDMDSLEATAKEILEIHKRLMS